MRTPLHRPICDRLGCTYPVALAGMGGVARAELAAAVIEAGGFGTLGMVREPPALIRSEVAQLRRRTGGRFGVNLIPAATDAALLDAQIETCIALEVPVVVLFWDVMPAVMARLRAAGITVLCQIGSAGEAAEAEAAGAAAIIAQGVEAGGHVRGLTPLETLVPEVAAAVTVPVLAAGGLADGADLATVMALGAQGAVLGTALMATHESFAHTYHKHRLVDARADDTVLTDVFHVNWPRGAKVRVLRNSVISGERGDPFAEGRVVIGEEEGRPIHLFSTDSPLRSMTGDFEAMALYAGRGVGRIDAIVPAGERLRAILAEAEALVDAGAAAPAAPQFASPACSAREMDDAYMGFAARDEIVAALNELLEAERAGARVALRSRAAAQDDAAEALLAAIQRDEARWCAVLTRAIHALDGTPSPRTGAFLDKALAIPELPARLAFLNRGQGWVVRKLTDLLPRIRDDELHAALRAMLDAHAHNIGTVERHLSAREPAR